jgi:uncharacterized DUF497 family protein
MRIDFDWDPAKAASNIAKHDGVTFVEAMTGPACARSVAARTRYRDGRPAIDVVRRGTRRRLQLRPPLHQPRKQ